MKRITISKYSVFKAVIQLGIVAGIAGVYVHSVHKQIIVNDINDAKALSFENVTDKVGAIITETYNNVSGSFLSLIKKAEGLTLKFTPDNKGYTVGYGYNPSQNDASFNKNILDYAQVDEETKNKILQNSKDYKNISSSNVPQTLKDIKLTKEQIDRMALYSQTTYEKDFIFVLSSKIDKKGLSSKDKNELIKKYYTLPENQRSVLIHMAYKVGRGGLDKYNNFFNDFINYLQTPTLENKKIVANDFVYHYKKNGVTLSDTRVSNMHRDLFLANIKPTDSHGNIIIKAVDPTSTAVKPLTESQKKKEATEQEKFHRALKDVQQKVTFAGLFGYLKNTYKTNMENANSNKESNFNKQSNLTSSTQTNNSQNNDTEDEEEYYEDENEVISTVSVTINGKKIR